MTAKESRPEFKWLWSHNQEQELKKLLENFCIFKQEHRYTNEDSLIEKYIKYLKADLSHLEYPIDHPIFNWSTRAIRVLHNIDIKTLSDLTERSETELLRARNCGRTTIKEIKAVLWNFGYSLQ